MAISLPTTRIGRVALAVLALVIAFAAVVFVNPFAGPATTVTAEFTRAVGVYVGSDVRVLGVHVGTITAVEPTGETITVTMELEDGYPIPHDAEAIVIPPSIVADRYIQLAPAYTGGREIADGDHIGVERTVVPLELDEVYATLDELSAALGENGSLAELVETARANLEGNGADLATTLDSLADVAETLDEHGDDLWGTVDNLAEFTEALAASDAQVALFNEQLASVSTQLSDERDNLSTAVEQLTLALADVSRFVDDNAEILTENIDQLASLTDVFARQQEALITILDYAPVALTNLDLAYNARSGTLDTRDDVLGPYDPAGFLCSQLIHAVGIEEVPLACFDLADALAASGIEMPAELAALVGANPVELP
ncbi:MCE family protein [Stackebrandtia soli]|uniref:MCE family protein n=1 Tax=Stackebrandtia soli TaxID=1892856 RepID=UPI0039E8EB43